MAAAAALGRLRWLLFIIPSWVSHASLWPSCSSLTSCFHLVLLHNKAGSCTMALVAAAAAAATGTETGHWGYVWSQLEWKPHFISVLPGKLQVFSTEQQDTLKKNILLSRCTVKIVECTELSTTANLPFWRIRNKASTKQNLPEPEGVIVAVKSLSKHKLLILASSQDEAQCWKNRIECAATGPVPQGSKQRSVAPKRLLLKLLSPRKQTELQVRALPFRWETSPRCSASQEVSSGIELDSLRKCVEFLKSGYFHYEQALEVARGMVDHFNGSFQMGDYTLPNELRIEAWKSTLLRIVKTMRGELGANDSTLENSEQLWLACEAWVMSAVHDKIMGASKQMFSENDKQLGQTLTKLGKVDSAVLGVRKEIRNSSFFADAASIFASLNSYRTPLEKAICLRRTVMCIVNGIQVDGSKGGAEGMHPCTDDLLSLMLLLMAHTKVRHLAANACFMGKFFCLREDGADGELGYHITNFVAACTHLNSSDIQRLVNGR